MSDFTSFLRSLLNGEPGLFWSGNLMLAGLPIRKLPARLTVTGHLDLRQCARLREIGDELSVGGDLLIGGTYDMALPGSHPPAPWKKWCTSAEVPLRRLPEHLHVGRDLVLCRCTQLETLPASMRVKRNVRLLGLRSLNSLPVWTYPPLKLHLCGSPMLKQLPERWKAPLTLIMEGVGLEEWPKNVCWQPGTRLMIRRAWSLKHLPDLPQDGTMRVVRLNRCNEVSLPASLHATDTIVIFKTKINALPPSLSARKVHIEACHRLTRAELHTGSTAFFSLTFCDAVDEVCFHDSRLVSCELSYCKQLKTIRGVHFHALENQQPRLGLVGCGLITGAPPDLQVTPADTPLCIRITGSAIRSLPEYAFKVVIDWRGARISAEAFFHPERLTPTQVLSETNAEVRRVMLERIGMQNFLDRNTHTVLDADADAGGARQLVSFAFTRSGVPPLMALRQPFRSARTPPPPVPVDIRMLHCRCPSTAREYLLCVPSTVTTCHAAAAWLAGFDNPDDYQPLVET